MRCKCDNNKSRCTVANMSSAIRAPLIVLLLLLLAATVCTWGARVDRDEVVAKIFGGARVARNLAAEMGYRFIGPVTGFSNVYILTPIEHLHEKRDRPAIHKRLVNDYRVFWADRQVIKSRQKRDYFNDELWPQEWYLQDTRTRRDLPKLDLNVLPVYRLGITGKNVRISILDDGIEYTHDDLKSNYDASISWDCNEDDDDPLPRYDLTKQNSHGTRCAGEVAMSANNRKCGVGIAYDARIGGVKMLDGLVNDRIEGTALSYAQDLVDVYSASWGPNDDGKTVDGPGRLAKAALKRGITYGRGGKGSIYVWASGNGGSQDDNCNCDGYLASRYTISIGSASQRGEFPWYGEACASTLAVTYSSGAYHDQMIATTDLHNECTIKHTGTSASAPLAAGIIALALQANNKLTWRDVQHLIVWTSELAPVVDNPGWILNTAGLWTNTRFGFGLMNAFGLVRTAANWTNVPPASQCIVRAKQASNGTFGYRSALVLNIPTNGCKKSKDEVNYLEHVELQASIQYSIRGAIEIELISPGGTRVQLLGRRKLDDSSDGFQDWSFMSVMTWGERAEGVWLLRIVDNIGPSTNYGTVSNIQLRLHGTKSKPDHMRSGPRAYNQNYNRIHNYYLDLEQENDVIPLFDYY